ncbi:MAG: hypothetical protein LUH02_07295 [Erysipelotrichaceae bacterium]|nr:hypothetical protein [Erysipelotrichaceae bacterium]
MKDSEYINYLKNELKSYIYIMKMIEDLKIKKKLEIDKKRSELAEIKERMLYTGSPSFDSVRNGNNANDERTLRLLIKEESLTSEIKEIESRYNKIIEIYQTRIDIINDCLRFLNTEDRNIIDDVFIKGVGYNKACDKHHYSRQGLFQKVNTIVKRMIKYAKLESC